MKTSVIRQGQSEIGIVEHQGKQFAAYGASVNGKEISAYHGKNFTLTDWGSRVILDCRCSVVQKFRLRWGDEAFALVFKLTNGRAIVGYSLGERMLFRGELVDETDERELKRLAIGISEHWIERDEEDDDDFQEELRREDAANELLQHLP